MIIAQIIGVVLFVLIVVTIVNIIEDTINKNKSKISFKESMDLTELPVVTFYNGSNKFNFLLDTGSNNSIINESVLKIIKHNKIEESVETIGLGGSMQSLLCSIKFYYKEKEFEDVFTIANMDEQFNIIKQEDGVTIHGILGSKFFEKYKYVLDFKDLVAYIR